jgi:DNA-directed RNA polymerase subunit RPC12/RpoP
MDNNKPTFSLLRRIGRRTSEPEKAVSVSQQQNESEKQTEPLELKPAMPELGTAPCPVCGHKVAVFVTRTKRPFINCGYCSARIFYNGSRSMELVKDQIKAPKKGGWPK